MRCTNAKQVIFIGVHSVRRSTAFTVARAHVADAGCLGSVVECCGSALLSVTSSVWRVFFSRYACLSSGLVVTSIFTDDWKFSSKGQIKDLILVLTQLFTNYSKDKV